MAFGTAYINIKIDRIRLHNVNYLLIIIFVLVTSFFATGCADTIVYGYNTSEIEYDWGKIGARLLGNNTRESFKLISGPPYELFIWFVSENNILNKFEVHKVSLRYKDDSKTIFSTQNNLSLEVIREKDRYVAYLSFKKINCSFKDLNLVISFKTSDGDNIKEHEASFHFEKQYERYWQLVSH